MEIFSRKKEKGKRKTMENEKFGDSETWVLRERERAACFVSFYRGFKRVKVLYKSYFCILYVCIGLPLFTYFTFFVFIFILSFILSYSFSVFLSLCFIILINFGPKFHTTHVTWVTGVL